MTAQAWCQQKLEDPLIFAVFWKRSTNFRWVLEDAQILAGFWRPWSPPKCVLYVLYYRTREKRVAVTQHPPVHQMVDGGWVCSESFEMIFF